MNLAFDWRNVSEYPAQRLCCCSGEVLMAVRQQYVSAQSGVFAVAGGFAVLLALYFFVPLFYLNIADRNNLSTLYLSYCDCVLTKM